MSQELYYDKYIDELSKAVELLLGGEAFVNYFSKTVTVYKVSLDTLKEFVEMSKFKELVHDVSYDYDYGYDEYCDPLTVAKDRVLLYCKTLCELDCTHECNSCFKCETE